MMKFYFKQMVLLSAFLLGFSGIYAQVSVTATAGTTGPTSYTTLNDAFAAINAGTHQGSIQIAITGNTTEPAVSIPLLKSATPSSYTDITIKPSGGDFAINSAAAPTASRGVIELFGADNVTIDGDDPLTAGVQNLSFVVATNTTTGTAAIRLSSTSTTGTDGADNVTIKNCNIIGGRSSATSTTTSYGIVMSASSGITTGAYSSINTKIDNNIITRCYRGIYANGSSATYPNTGLIVSNNTFGSSTSMADNIGLSCLFLSYTSATAGATSAVVENNIMRTGDVSLSGAGLSASINGVEVNTVNAGLKIRKNKIVVIQPSINLWGSYGINLTGSASCNDIEIYNNMITVANAKATSTSISSFTAYGIRYTAGATLQKVNYNTIYIPLFQTGSTVNNTSYGVAATVAGVTFAEFQNNLVVNENVGTGTYGFYLNTLTNVSGATMDRNNYYTPSGNVGYLTSAQTTLAAWKTATSKDANGLAAPAVFKSVFDLHIDTTSSANVAIMTAAAPLASITTDFDGQTRSATTPSIGADEFVVPACSGQPDAGILTASVNPVCLGSSSLLSATGITSADGAGTTYQWYESLDSITWSAITGATTKTYNYTNATSKKYFMFVNTCSASLLADSAYVTVSLYNPNYATIPYAQTFDSWVSVCGNTDVPTNEWRNSPITGNNSWRRQDQGATASWSSASGIVTPKTGAGAADFHSYNASSGTIGLLDLYADMSNPDPITLKFDHINTSGTDTLFVQFSQDNGVTFADLASYAIATAWTTRTINIGVVARPKCIVRFKAKSDFGTTDIGIDNLSLSFPCSGKPTAGTVVPSANPVCYGSSVNFTLPTATVADGLTYQWLLSTDGVTYTAGAADTLSSLTYFVTDTVWAKAIVTCTGLSDTTAPVQITLSNFLNCYCSSAATSTTEDDIGQVKLGALLNPAVRPTPQQSNAAANKTYTDFTSLPATDLLRTVSYPATIYHFHDGTDQTANSSTIYIDFNHNGLFTDAGENFPLTKTGGFLSDFTGSILIPATADTGVTRMRVALREGTVSSPCGSQGSWGEVEDYMVHISPAPLCSNPPVGGVITGQLSVCPGVSTTLVDTGYTLGTTVQWQSSLDSITWSDVASATTPTYVTPAIFDTVYYRFRSVCVDTAYSAVAKVVLNPAYSCYCNTGLGGFCGGNDITNVLFANINNTSTCNSSGSNVYTAFPDTGVATTDVYQTVPTNLTVTLSGTSIVSVWIDYDQNGVFDASEWTQVTTSASSATVSITVPPTALLGKTGMRIRSRATGNTNGSGSACASFGSGEAEDYIINILPAPPCTTPPVAGTLTGPATANAYDIGLYITTGSVGTKTWQFATSPAGPYTIVGGVNGDSLSINLNVADTFYFRAIASNPGCVNDTTNIVQTIITLPGDDVCNAVPLSFGTNGPFITTAATVQVGEPAPPGTACSSQSAWCNSTLSNSMWFTFVAPASGRVSIQSPEFDTQLALWSADNCDTILKGGATLVAANDDASSPIPNGGVTYSSFITAATCLTPGKTYYVQLDPYSSPGDTASIILTDLGALNPAFTLDTVYCEGAATVALNPVTAGGTFTGTGVSGTNFSPVTAGVGGPYTIKYALSACDTLVKTTRVVAKPTATTAITNVACFGGSTGAINVTISGSSPFTSLWSNGATTEDLTAVSAGTYSDTITDVYGCKATLTGLSVSQPTAALLGALDSLTNVKCFGDTTGAIYVSVTGGTAPYTYLWSNGSTTEDLVNVPAGLYTGTVTDANACTFTTPQPVPVTQPAAALVATLDSTTNVKCNGQLNGAAYVTVTGGTTAYTYAWTGGTTNEDLTAVAAGTYSVTITDANACSTTASATITEPSTLLATTDSTKNVTCNGLANGAVYVSVTGGTTTYTYAWSNGATTEDLSSVGAAVYVLTVTDANGCSTTASGTVSEPTVLAATTDSVKNVTCNGLTNGAVYVTVTGGTSAYTYAWTSGATSQDLTGVASGTYTVSVTDAHGCSTTATGTVTQPAVLTASTDSIVNVKCNGGTNGSVYISVVGGTASYTYAWTGGTTNQDLLGVGAGAYSVSVTDANGCSTTLAGTVTAPTALSLTTDSIKNVKCNGQGNGAVYITVTGGTAAYTYSWTGGATSQDLTGVVAGSYVVTVTDANGCIKTTNATVSQPAVLTVSTTKTNEIQNGAKGSVSAVVTGGTPTYTYAWTPSGNTATISNLTAGTYVVTVTDANGCTATAQDTVKFIYTGIDNVDEVSVFNVYPNPTTGKFFVQVEMAEKANIALEIRSITGQLVYTATESDVKSKVIEVNAADFADGMYIVRLVFGDKQITRRITVSK